jgi:DNA-binding transcriptional regulator YiaG
MLDLEPIQRKRAATKALPPPLSRKALRQAAGLSQQDIAGVLGVHRETVSRWELGTRTPRGELLVRYLELLHELGQ